MVLNTLCVEGVGIQRAEIRAMFVYNKNKLRLSREIQCSDSLNFCNTFDDVNPCNRCVPSAGFKCIESHRMLREHKFVKNKQVGAGEGARNTSRGDIKRALSGAQ